MSINATLAVEIGRLKSQLEEARKEMRRFKAGAEKDGAVNVRIVEPKGGLQSFRAALNNYAQGEQVFLKVEAGLQALLDKADQLQDLSDRLGVGTETLQKFGNAAALNGSSLEGMAQGFNKLEISRSKALAGDEEMRQRFAALGVTLDDLQSKNPEEIMLQIGRGSMEAADMVAVMGKSALELRVTLAGLADGSIELGKVMSEDTVAKLAAAKDAFEELKNTLMVAFGGAVIWVSQQWENMTSTIFAQVQKVVATLTAAKTALGQVFSGDRSGAADTIVQLKKDLADIEKVRDEAIKENNTPEKRERRRFGTDEAAEGKEESAAKRESERKKLDDAEKKGREQAAAIQKRREEEAAKAAEKRAVAMERANEMERDFMSPADRVEALKQELRGIFSAAGVRMGDMEALKQKDPEAYANALKNMKEGAGTGGRMGQTVGTLQNAVNVLTGKGANQIAEEQRDLARDANDYLKSIDQKLNPQPTQPTIPVFAFP